MHTQFDLATDCEQWADESDKIADAILATLEYSNAEIRRTKLARVSVLRHEAEHLREKAKRLRGLAVPAPDGSKKN